MRIRFYQVECGDAASISYNGDDGKEHTIFIDAGYERTFRDVLSKEIDKIGGHIDLWIISHIHDDHIGGAISYVHSIQNREREDVVSNWLYNPPFFIKNAPTNTLENSTSTASSIAQGETLTLYLAQIKKLPLADITNSLLPFNLHGLKLTVLSPSIENLKSLREKYYNREVDYEEITRISEPVSSDGNDYFRKIETFKGSFKEDRSIENLSSISVIADYKGKKTLWLADAPPGIIISNLKSMGYSSINPIEVDLVKVSHHGSKANNSEELYSMIRCARYLFSANGDNKHSFPTKECIARILNNRNRNLNIAYELIFTYDTPTLRKLFDVDGEEVYQKWNFRVTFPCSNGKVCAENKGIDIVL